MFCPVINNSFEKVSLAHGGGGKLTSLLIENVFKKYFNNDYLNQGHDAAVLPRINNNIAFTTDSYVIKPFFFNGGNIGKLAVCGTINDLMMAGALPKYLSVGFIIEEGFSFSDLELIVRSMADEAKLNNIHIVTGDTKVIERTSSEPNIYINTTGIGVINNEINSKPANINSSDVIIVSNDIGRHSIAIMAEREGLSFETDIESDCASLKNVVLDLLKQFGNNIHCMRDCTRGGLATTCIELASESGLSFNLFDDQIPVDSQVRSACEILGLNSIYCANEGCFVVIVPQTIANQVLTCLHKYDVARNASVIGSVTESHNGKSEVLLETVYGSKYRLVKQSGEQLPRIC